MNKVSDNYYSGVFVATDRTVRDLRIFLLSQFCMSKLSSYDLFMFHQHGLKIFFLVGRHGVLLWCGGLMVAVGLVFSLFQSLQKQFAHCATHSMPSSSCGSWKHLQKLSHLIANPGKSRGCGWGLQEGLWVSISLETCWNDSPTTLWQHRILCWNVWDFRQQSSDWPYFVTNDHKKKEGCYSFIYFLFSSLALWLLWLFSVGHLCLHHFLLVCLSI